MARDKDPPLRSSSKDDSDAWLDGIVADEDGGDRIVFWRLSAWGFAAAAAIAVGFVVSKSDIDTRVAETAARYLDSKAAQIETVSRDTQAEARRLAAAIETLNTDRDRIYARLSTVEQGFDSVTGSIKATEPSQLKPATPPADTRAATRPQASEPVPPESAQKVTAPEAAPAESQAGSGSAALVEQPLEQWALGDPDKPGDAPAPLTEFGIDLGAANSLEGLRAIWRTTSSIHKAALAGLTPIVTVQERGAKRPVQLRLVAGPIKDAAAAARLCVLLMEKAKDCKTTAFDGQKLQVHGELQDKQQDGAPAKRPKARAPKQNPKPAAAPVPASRTAPAQVSVLPSFWSGQ